MEEEEEEGEGEGEEEWEDDEEWDEGEEEGEEGEEEDGEEEKKQSSDPDCAAAKLQGGGRRAPRGMCGAKEVTSPDHARQAECILQDAALMALLERAAFKFVEQYTVGGPPTPGSSAVRQPSSKAVAALRSPSRKWSFGMGLAATASQQPGDPPSGGMQRAFHGCLAARAYDCNGGDEIDEFQVSTTAAHSLLQQHASCCSTPGALTYTWCTYSTPKPTQPRTRTHIY